MGHKEVSFALPPSGSLPGGGPLHFTSFIYGLGGIFINSYYNRHAKCPEGLSAHDHRLEC